MEKVINTYDEIMNAALALPSKERERLAEHLMETLDTEDQERIDALWLKKQSDDIKRLRTEL